MSSQLSKLLFNFTSLVNIVTSKLTLFLQNHIHIFLLFCLGPPKGRKQDALISEERKVKEMYKTVFHKACELGREQELFGITKDEKQLYDTSELLVYNNFLVFCSKSSLLYTICDIIVMIVFH